MEQSNNKCVFSAATSSVQTFRLGKSIASEKGKLILHLSMHSTVLIVCDNCHNKYAILRIGKFEIIKHSTIINAVQRTKNIKYL
jgi:hypothetical protein